MASAFYNFKSYFLSFEMRKVLLFPSHFRLLLEIPAARDFKKYISPFYMLYFILLQQFAVLYAFVCVCVYNSICYTRGRVVTTNNLLTVSAVYTPRNKLIILHVYVMGQRIKK